MDKNQYTVDFNVNEAIREDDQGLINIYDDAFAPGDLENKFTLDKD